MQNKLKSWLKEILSFVLIAILVANISSWVRSPSLKQKDLPQFNLELVDQTIFDHSTRAKESIVLYFWGSWCSVCSFQSPVISTLSKSNRVLSFAVNSGNNQQIKAYLEQNDYKFPSFNDVHHQWSKTFKVSAYPTLFIFDKDGKLRFTEVGYTSLWGLKLRLLWLELWS